MKIWAKTQGEVSEGKFLVVRRDGTIPPWPHFVLGARDPAAPAALHAYADECDRLRALGDPKFTDSEFAQSVHELARDFVGYRISYGSGDPEAAPHRKDDPAVILAMRHQPSTIQVRPSVARNRPCGCRSVGECPHGGIFDAEPAETPAKQVARDTRLTEGASRGLPNPTIFTACGRNGDMQVDRLADDSGLAVVIGLGSVVLSRADVVRLDKALHEWVDNQSNRASELAEPAQVRAVADPHEWERSLRRVERDAPLDASVLASELNKTRAERDAARVELNEARRERNRLNQTLSTLSATADALDAAHALSGSPVANRTDARQRAVRVVMAFDEKDKRPGRTLAELIVRELREVEAERDKALASYRSAVDQLAYQMRPGVEARSAALTQSMNETEQAKNRESMALDLVGDLKTLLHTAVNAFHEVRDLSNRGGRMRQLADEILESPAIKAALEANPMISAKRDEVMDRLTGAVAERERYKLALAEIAAVLRVQAVRSLSRGPRAGGARVKCKTVEELITRLLNLPEDVKNFEVCLDTESRGVPEWTGRLEIDRRTKTVTITTEEG